VVGDGTGSDRRPLFAVIGSQEDIATPPGTL